MLTVNFQKKSLLVSVLNSILSVLVLIEKKVRKQYYLEFLKCEIFIDSKRLSEKNMKSRRKK